MTQNASPYDQGSKLEPKPWVKDGITGTEEPRPAENADYGRVDFDNDEGATELTVWAVPTEDGIVLRVQSVGETPITIETEADSLDMTIQIDHKLQVRDITSERMAALMWRHNFTVSSLAVAIGKGRVSVSTKMNNHKRWYMDELVSIAEVLDTTVGYLLGETDDDRRPAHLRANKKAPTATAVGASVAVPPEGFEPPTYGSEGVDEIEFWNSTYCPDTVGELIVLFEEIG